MPLPPSTLNQALDQLPQLLLTLGKLQQDRRDEELRRDIQQASQRFQVEMLEKRIAAERELTEFKAGLEEPRDPPEVSILGRRIEKDLDVLRDPDTAFRVETGEMTIDEINVIKSRVTSIKAEIERLSGREHYVDPSLIRIAPKEISPAATPKPTTVEAVEGKPKPRIFESRDEYQARIKEWEGTAPPAEGVPVEELPPGFPDPASLPEGQTATYNGEPWVILNGQWVKGK